MTAVWTASSGAALSRSYEPFEEPDTLLSNRHVVVRPRATTCSAIGDLCAARTDAQGWLPKALAELARLSQLGQNWDGYEAIPVDAAVARSTAALLRKLESSGLMQQPRLFATAGGGVSVEWRRDDSELSLEVVAPGQATVYADDGERWWEGPLSEAPDFVFLILNKASSV